MKKLFIISVFACMFCMQDLHAAPQKPNDAQGIHLWIPGFLVKIAGNIASDHMDQKDAAAISILQHVGSITICVKEGEDYSPGTDKKMDRKLARMKKQDFEELFSVIEDDAHVNVSVQSGKNGVIKKMVIIANEKDESYVFLKMHCRLSANDIAQLGMMLKDSE